MSEELPKMESGDVQNEEVDPRVEEELESLNCASEEINKLERELDMARNKFRSLLSEASGKINQLGKKLGKCVNKTRPYFILQQNQKNAEDELQRATIKFQRANSLYVAARETVALAEEKTEEKQAFDSAWQEMLNHATMRLVESQTEKRSAEEEHQRRAMVCADLQQKMRFYEKDMPRSINRAKPYFEMKQRLENRLQQERQSVEDLQRALSASKERYRDSLKSLEQISEEIHRKRQLQVDLPLRTPGVGAESSPDSQSDLPSINLDTLSETLSDIYYHDSEVASLASLDSCDTYFPPFDDPRSRDPPLPLKDKCQISQLARSISQTFTTDVNSLSMSGSYNSQNGIPKVTSATSMEKPQVSHVQSVESFKQACEQSVEKSQQSRLQSVENSNDGNVISVENNQKSHNVDQDSCSLPDNTLVGAQNDTSAISIGAGITSRQPISLTDSPLTYRREPASGEFRHRLQGQQPRSRSLDRKGNKIDNNGVFPILQGLTDTNRQLSPKLPHGRPRGQELPQNQKKYNQYQGSKVRAYAVGESSTGFWPDDKDLVSRTAAKSLGKFHK